MTNTKKTLFEKIWDAHVVAAPQDEPLLVYIDLHLLHEVTSPQAFEGLRMTGRKVRRPDRTLATVDHNVPTVAKDRLFIQDDIAAKQIDTLRRNCKDFGVQLYDIDSPQQGIVHIIGPELGFTKPGMTIVCGDSHTSTHGAFGALAFGIGTSEVGHVLATQCLLQRKPKAMAVEVHGRLQPGVDAKDLVLHIIGRIGVDGGTGCVIEYRGEAIRALSMEQRMTVCNMSIEAGARAGMIAPDDTTFAWLRGRARAPQGEAWTRALAHWKTLHSDRDARFDRVVEIDAAAVRPTLSYGTHPGMVVDIEASVPQAGNALQQRALDYMGLRAGARLAGTPVDVVFVGSCTNGRLSDLRAAAAVLRGRRLARGVRMLVVPGSAAVKHDAEQEGLDAVFRAAGAEWREPGCSMCIAMNGDLVAPGQLAVSTSNRNFEGRQGPGARTVLASPASAAAAAVAGHIVDPRAYTIEEAVA